MLSNGKVVQFTLHEMRGLIYGRRVLALMTFFLVVIASSSPTLFPTLPIFTSRAFYWGISMILYLLFLPLWAPFILGIWERAFGTPMPLILASSPLVVALTAFSATLHVIFGDFLPNRGHSITVVTFLMNCLIAHLIETMALAWLLPLYRAEQSRQDRALPRGDIRHPADPPAAPQPEMAPAAPPPEPQFVVLAGRSMPLKLIQRVQSAEHYLILTTAQKTTEVRARMKDFLEQVTDDDGIQTHRGFWVSADEAVELDGGTVRTKSGASVPVSRGRMPVVRDWFQQQGKPH